MNVQTLFSSSSTAVTNCDPFAQGMQRLCGIYWIQYTMIQYTTLLMSASVCRSVDAVAKEPGDGMPTTDFEALFAGLSGNCKY